GVQHVAFIGNSRLLPGVMGSRTDPTAQRQSWNFVYGDTSDTTEGADLLGWAKLRHDGADIVVTGALRNVPFGDGKATGNQNVIGSRFAPIPASRLERSWFGYPRGPIDVANRLLVDVRNADLDGATVSVHYRGGSASLRGSWSWGGYTLDAEDAC